MLGQYFSLYGSEESDCDGGARSQHLQAGRVSAVILPAAGNFRGGCGQYDCQRLLQSRIQGTADGIRGRGAEPAQCEFGRSGRLIRPQERTNLLKISDLTARVAG